MSTYDTLIRGARIIDGSGNPWTRAVWQCHESSLTESLQSACVPVRVVL